MIEKERVLIEIYNSGLQGLVGYEESREFLEEIYSRMELPSKEEIIKSIVDEVIQNRAEGYRRIEDKVEQSRIL